MNLAEQLQNVPQLARTERHLDRILESVSAEDREGLIQALRSPSIPASHIARVLRGAGHSISETAVRTYRRDSIPNRGD